MKIKCSKIGGRTVKTVLAVYLCLLIGIVRKSDTAFYAAIAAVLCVQRTSKDSIREAFNREVATVIGGIWGMLVLLFERYFLRSPYEVLRYQFPIRRTTGRRICTKGKRVLCCLRNRGEF